LGSTNGASKNHSVSENQVVFRRIDELMALHRASRTFFQAPVHGRGQENFRFGRSKGRQGLIKESETKTVIHSCPGKNGGRQPI
jgi:hypothetical protein